jgi:serine/threonine protein kinase
MSNGNSYIGHQVGNYRITKEIASGAFGSVYQGKHIVFTDEPIVAIKLLHAHLASSEERDRFFQEARLLKKLKHPYILPIIDAGIHQNFPYIVAEYAPNGSLRDRLQRHHGRPLPSELVLTILSQIGQALHYAHQQNIVHRDLKPENILFNVKGDAVLADFGIATVLATASVKQTAIMGTPAYMAPEQFRGIVSKETDQYALGCIAYELFTGSKPFNAPDFIALGYKHSTEYPIAPTQLNPQLSKHIEHAIFKAITKERSGRRSDCFTFVSALKTIPYRVEQPATVEQLIGHNLSLAVGARSDPGIKRKYKPNEDSLLAMQGARPQNAQLQQFGLFVVADGMSDHANGQDASRLAIQTIINYMVPPLSEGNDMGDEDFVKLLADGVQQANAAVYKHNQEQRGDMGTTMTASLVIGSMAYVANVGDSRTYLYREPQGLRKVTRDHSVVASLVDAGVIKPDDIYTHPERDRIYRSLGEKPVVEVDTFKVPLQPGDKLLLCSDGLWDMVRDPEIQRVMRAPAPDPSQTGDALIKAALDAGGEENVSVIVVHITEPRRQGGIEGIQLLAKPDSVSVPNLPK